MFPGDGAGASNDSGVVDNGNFQRFRWLFFSNTLEMRPVLLYSDMHAIRHRLFSDTKMHDLE